MRVRLEELAHFLQQLIDAQGGDVTLDTSCLSVEVTTNSLNAIGHQLFKVREGLQRSIDESRMLSISVLAEQTSMLEEMDLAGLDEEEDVEEKNAKMGREDASIVPTLIGVGCIVVIVALAVVVVWKGMVGKKVPNPWH